MLFGQLIYARFISKRDSFQKNQEIFIDHSVFHNKETLKLTLINTGNYNNLYLGNSKTRAEDI